MTKLENPPGFSEVTDEDFDFRDEVTQSFWDSEKEAHLALINSS